MKCWVCKRQARGYGHTDGRFKTADPRRYVLDWVFCSRRCQDAFHALYGNWQRAKDGRIDRTEVAMIDPSDVELAAMRQCLKAFGEAAGEIGFGKPLGDYSKRKRCALSTPSSPAGRRRWSRTTKTKFPPVRGMPPTPDPLAPDAANPFADFNDDIPF
ncbi:DUF6511 domain-containing protein [Pseudomonas aeruginosa]|nr:DUF6511 domain-containing protein [Pseudomonas aeruginosa]